MLGWLNLLPFTFATSHFTKFGRCSQPPHFPVLHHQHNLAIILSSVCSSILLPCQHSKTSLFSSRGVQLSSMFLCCRCFFLIPIAYLSFTLWFTWNAFSGIDVFFFVIRFCFDVNNFSSSPSLQSSIVNARVRHPKTVFYRCAVDFLCVFCLSFLYDIALAGLIVPRIFSCITTITPSQQCIYGWL